MLSNGRCIGSAGRLSVADIEPYGYLLLVLSMLPYLGKSPTHEELEKLMPWHPAVRHREHIRK